MRLNMAAAGLAAAGALLGGAFLLLTGRDPRMPRLARGAAGGASGVRPTRRAGSGRTSRCGRRAPGRCRTRPRPGTASTRPRTRASRRAIRRRATDATGPQGAARRPPGSLWMITSACGKLAQDRAAQAGADRMRVVERLRAVQLDVQVDEDAAAGGARLEVVVTMDARPVVGDVGDPGDHLRIGAPVHQGVEGGLADPSAPMASIAAAPSATTLSICVSPKRAEAQSETIAPMFGRRSPR
jgi:hypothetical protein